MNIALLSDDYRVRTMSHFCDIYRDFFLSHKIFTVYTFNKEVNRKFCVDSIRTLFSLEEGGVTQLAAKAYHNELDVIFFFRGNADSSKYRIWEDKLFKICDENNIPYATNLATASALINTFKRSISKRSGLKVS